MILEESLLVLGKIFETYGVSVATVVEDDTDRPYYASSYYFSAWGFRSLLCLCHKLP